MKQEQLSRRGFLKGAGLGALAVSGMSAGLLGGCAPQPNGSASEDQGDGDDTLAETGKPLHIGAASQPARAQMHQRVPEHGSRHAAGGRFRHVVLPVAPTFGVHVSAAI